MPPFHTETALVTGAASGIGLATARHLAAHGARRLVLVDIDATALVTGATLVTDGGYTL